MSKYFVNNFGGGMTNDIYSAGAGEFSSSRNFDVLSYPNRLYPLPSLIADTANTDIGNMILASDGSVYGLGTDVGNSAPTAGMIWKRVNSWSQFSHGSGNTTTYTLLCEYLENGTNSLLFDYSGGIWASDPNDAGAGSGHAFTYVTICQGFVHPFNKRFYWGYSNSTATYIGSNIAGSWSDTALTLSKRWTVTSLSNYGEYLAIAVNDGLKSGVFLWDMVQSTWQSFIDFGEGTLKIINNLYGILVGVMSLGYSTTDFARLLIKGYSGGQVEIIKELLTIKQTTTSPSITINSRVNFVSKNRLFFSADLVGGSTSPSQKGLWSIGKVNGRWSLNVDSVGSTDGSDVSVLAAVYKGNLLHVCHTAVGTLTVGANNSVLTVEFANSSIHETAVNPTMSDTDRIMNKKLASFTVFTLPMTSSGQVVAKYRVDSTGAWTNIFTKTSTSPDTNLVAYKSEVASSANFTEGYNYEFRLESTNGAQIVGYEYDVTPATT